MSIRNMSEKEFADYCRSKELDENEIILADLIIRQGLKGQSLYDSSFYSPTTIKVKRQIIFAKLGINKY
jgi:hypothetical protein